MESECCATAASSLQPIPLSDEADSSGQQIVYRIQEPGIDMKIIIGGQDYSSALDAAHPLTIERKLNQPSLCQLWLMLAANASMTLQRNQPLRIEGDDGTCYFTGYIASTPMPEYCGDAL